MLIVEQPRGRDVTSWRLGSRTTVFSANSAAGPPLSAMDIEKVLAQSIAERTGGRVRMLQVEFRGRRIVMRGCAASYHAVQLAVAGLQESLQALRLDRPEHVELDFDVAAATRSGERQAACNHPR